MKKLSISLFAVLAIVVAVSSAFTTNKSMAGRDTYKMWALDLVSGATESAYDNVTGSPLADKQFDFVNDYTGSFSFNTASNSTQTIADYLDSTIDRLCNVNNPSSICAVKILYDNDFAESTNGKGQVLDIEFGDLVTDPD